MHFISYMQISFIWRTQGTPNMPDFLAPHRDERYDMPEFYGGDALRGRNELFNVRHSSLRTAIERTFSLLKKRFPIF